MVGRRGPVRIYADTSVFGGVLDDEFSDASQAFFEHIRKGRFRLVTSAIVQEEIQLAPVEVRELFEEVLEIAEIGEVTLEVLRLQEAYVAAGIVSEKWATDAAHVAFATVEECEMIVSWNFKHIVHFVKIPLYNAVNTINGYRNIAIYSPFEVVSYEEEI